MTSLAPWALSLVSTVAHAGAIPDLLDASAQYTPSADLEDPRPAEVQVTSYDAALNVPIPLGKSTFLIPGAAYHVESTSFMDTPPDFAELRIFHSLDIPVMVIQLLPRNWALALRVAPGAAGDFQGFDSGVVHTSALVLATHVFSDRFVGGGGGMATWAFGSLLPLPALYVEWKPVDGFFVEAFAPAFAQVKGRIRDRVELGAKFDVAGNSYAIRDERIAGSWPCTATTDDPDSTMDESVAEPDACFDHVAYSVGAVGGTVGVRLVSSVWASALIGHSVFRRFEMSNADDDRIRGGLQNLPNTFLFRANLTWRIPERP